MLSQDEMQQTAYIQEIVYAIRRLIQANEIFTKELNKLYAVSAPQLSCLITLNDHGPLPPSVIAKYILVNSSTVTGIIDRLEKKKLVTRVRNSPDRRIINIQLTESGRELAEQAPPPVQHKMLAGLKNLPLNEIKQIVDGLNKLTTLMDLEDLSEAEYTDPLL